MIFMGSRRPENRHDPVALHFVDDTFVPINSTLHEIKHWLKTPHAKLGVAHTVYQVCGITNVGKEHSNPFAFPASFTQ